MDFLDDDDVGACQINHSKIDKKLIVFDDRKEDDLIYIRRTSFCFEKHTKLSHS